jgi:hypothetical protein
MLAERRIMRRDATDCLAHRPRYARSRALRRASRRALAPSSHTERARELTREELALLTCSRGAPEVVHALRLGDVTFDFRQNVDLALWLIEHSRDVVHALSIVYADRVPFIPRSQTSSSAIRSCAEGERPRRRIVVTGAIHIP